MTFFIGMVVFILYLAYDMGFHYLTFMKSNLKNKKKLTLARIMNSADKNSKNVLKRIGMTHVSCEYSQDEQ